MRNWCECHDIKPFNLFVILGEICFDERLRDLCVRRQARHGERGKGSLIRHDSRWSFYFWDETIDSRRSEALTNCERFSG